MHKINSFQDLTLWQVAHQLTLDIYKLSRKFPKEEIYGITSQIRRSSSSIAANIAEGKGRKTTNDFIRFLINARGSNEETKYFLILCRDLEYIQTDSYNAFAEKTDHIGRMINKLIYGLERKGDVVVS